jgi:hypothetical protein
VAGFDPFGDDRNCGDFSTWSSTQAFFIAAGGPANNDHQLDGDNDGTASNHSPARRRRSKKRTQQCHPEVLEGRQEGNNGNYSHPPETSHIPQPPSRSQE